MSFWAIVVAAGGGTRFGGVKQLEQLGDQRVIDWSVGVASGAADGVIVVTSPQLLDEVRWSVRADYVVVGGATRSESVRAGLAALPDGVEIVVIHDAARPLATNNLFSSVVDAILLGADGAVPGLPVSDTIKRVTATVLETIDRSELIAVQTPQAFRLDILRRAHAGEPNASDDAALVESIGGKVVAVQGEVRNTKITTPHDLVIARALIEAQ